jgi:hypothetical protein
VLLAAVPVVCAVCRAFGPLGRASYFLNSRVCRVSIDTGFARDVRLLHLGRDFERVAVGDEQIGDLADSRSSRAGRRRRDLRRVERHALQRLVARQAERGGHRGLVGQIARVGRVPPPSDTQKRTPAARSCAASDTAVVVRLVRAARQRQRLR